MITKFASHVRHLRFTRSQRLSSASWGHVFHTVFLPHRVIQNRLEFPLANSTWHGLLASAPTPAPARPAALFLELGLNVLDVVTLVVQFALAVVDQHLVMRASSSDAHAHTHARTHARMRSAKATYI